MRSARARLGATWAASGLFEASSQGCSESSFQAAPKPFQRQFYGLSKACFQTVPKAALQCFTYLAGLGISRGTEHAAVHIPRMRNMGS